MQWGSSVFQWGSNPHNPRQFLPWVGLTDSENILRICITVYTQYRRVMDRQTDRQTPCHGIVRAMHTRGAVKIIF